MKKIYMPLFVFLLLISFVSASVDTEFRCDDDVCKVGSLMNWSVIIVNNLNESVVIGKIWMVDKNTNQLIALQNSEDVELDINDSHDFIFQNLVPAPLSGKDSFDFQTCFYVNIGNGSDPICSHESKSLKVVLMEELIEEKEVVKELDGTCSSSSDCLSNEFCSETSCTSLSCEDNQVISGNECVTLSCAWYEERTTGSCAVSPLVYLFIFLVIVVVAVLIYQNTGKRRQKKLRRLKRKQK